MSAILQMVIQCTFSTILGHLESVTALKISVKHNSAILLILTHQPCFFTSFLDPGISHGNITYILQSHDIESILDILLTLYMAQSFIVYNLQYLNHM